MTNSATFAKSSMPNIYKEVEDNLTGYGMTLFLKQVQASCNYVAYHIETGSPDDDDFLTSSEALITPTGAEDPDLVDHPRFQTARQFLQDLATGRPKIRQRLPG